MAEAHNAIPPGPPEPAPDLPGSYSFSPHDLQRFFDAKWRLAECEVCQSSANNFHLQSGGGRFSALAALGNGILSGTTMATLHVALNLICTNCGNMKLILAPTIFRWLRENPPESLHAIHQTPPPDHPKSADLSNAPEKTTQDQQNIAFLKGDVEGIRNYLSQLGYTPAKPEPPSKTHATAPEAPPTDTRIAQNELRAAFADLRTLLQSTLHEQTETRKFLQHQESRIAQQGRSLQTTILLVALVIFAVLLTTFLSDHPELLVRFLGGQASK